MKNKIISYHTLSIQICDTCEKFQNSKYTCYLSKSNFELPHHDAEELVNVDLALPRLVRHLDHLLDLLLRDADPELAEHLAQVLTADAAVPVSVHHRERFPQLLSLVLVISFPFELF